MIHSEEYLNDTRYSWYNRDFLDLMAKRWQLDKVSSVVDVGCGLGHWNRLLIDYLKKPAELIGVDFEQKWILECEKQVEFYRKNQINFKSKNEAAENMSLPDNSCDLVTCQTLLIHVPSIIDTLQEFYRIVKPKGKVIIAEPNNLVNSSIIDPIEDRFGLDYFRNKHEFELGYSFGKYKQNEGKSHSVESIPDILYKLGFKNIQVFLSDKVIYGFENKRSDDFDDVLQSDFSKSQKYLEAAGISNSVHEAYWNGQKKYFEDRNSIAEKSGFFECRGSLMYLISAEKI